MKDNTFICSSCGAELPFSQCLEFDGQELCQSCLDSETAICSVCGDRIWNDNNDGDSDTPLCHSCYDRDFTNCIRCGALLRESNAYYSRDDEETKSLCVITAIPESQATSPSRTTITSPILSSMARVLAILAWSLKLMKAAKLLLRRSRFWRSQTKPEP